MSPATHIVAPVMRLNGSMVFIAACPLMAFAMCGATMPTNPIGPQNAVTAPVIMLQLNIDMNLIFLTFAPALVA